MMNDHFEKEIVSLKMLWFLNKYQTKQMYPHDHCMLRKKRQLTKQNTACKCVIVLWVSVWHRVCACRPPNCDVSLTVGQIPLAEFSPSPRDRRFGGYFRQIRLESGGKWLLADCLTNL